MRNIVLIIAFCAASCAVFAQEEPALDAGEQAMMQGITQQLKPVFGDWYDASYYNATITDGHVTGWDFSWYQNLPISVVPELFKFPYVRVIVLSDLGLSGDVEQLVDTLQIACADSLRELYISSNQLSGNIGAFAAHFPNLTILHAAYNRLSEVHPMVSPNVWLELYSQTLDEAITLDSRSRMRMENLMSALPEILYYNHGAQAYGSGISEWGISYPDAGITLVPYEEDGQTYIEWRPWGWNPLMIGEHDTVIISGYSTSATCPLELLYRMGDVNFSSTVDVADLQGIINQAMNISSFNAINFHAADLYTDSVINVQDVVRMVDTLLAFSVPVVFEAPSRRATAVGETVEAELYWQNGDLHVHSVKAVAALQVSIATAGTIEWRLGNGWQCSQAAAANGINAVVYSLSGATIPEGEDVVIAHCTDEAAVRYASLADRQARPIRVEVGANAPTAIETIDHREPSCRKVLKDGQLLIIRDTKMYNAQGIEL